jgi:hypothetical protein
MADRRGLAIVALLLSCAVARAQDLEPRAYSNAPVGLNFLVVAYAHAQGGVVFEPTVPLENAHLEVPSAAVAFARSLEVAGRSAKFDVVQPYAWLSGQADLNGVTQQRDVTGLADTRLRFSINLYGAPALTLKEYASYRQDVIVGVSVLATAPVGQYDPDRLANIGTNRWSVKPEVGVSWARGRWIFELDGAVALYQDNDDYFGGQTLEQDPIYSTQAHVIHSFRSGVWGAIDATWYGGGRTTTNGVEGDNLQRNTRVGLTLAFPVNRRNSIKLYASSGVSTRTGSDFDVGGIGWQYRWGGGI